MKWSLLLLSVFLLSTHSGASIVQAPFNRTMDLSPIEQILKDSPENLVKAIKTHEVDIYLLPLSKYESEENIRPALKNIPRLSAEKYAQYGLEELGFGDGEGLFISSLDSCCNLGKDTILVSGNVDDLTLVHELSHALFFKQMKPEDKALANTVEAQIKSADRVFRFRFDKVFRSPFLLTEKLWRRDLLNALNDYLEAVNNIIRFRISEEVVIERALQALVKSDSPFYNERRLSDGNEYADKRIEQARVMVADLEFVSDWSKKEIDVFEDSIELREKYELEKQYKDLNAKILALGKQFDDLRKFRVK